MSAGLNQEKDRNEDAFGRFELTENEIQLLYFFQTDFDEFSDYLTNENRSVRSLTDTTESEELAEVGTSLNPKSSQQNEHVSRGEKSEHIILETEQATIVSSIKNPEDIVCRIDKSVIQFLREPAKIYGKVSVDEIGVLHAQYVAPDQTKSTESQDCCSPECGSKDFTWRTLDTSPSTKNISVSGVNVTSSDSTIEVLTSVSSVMQCKEVPEGHHTADDAPRDRRGPWHLLLYRLPVLRTNGSSTSTRRGFLQKIRKIFQKE